jgi:hypothetical protein
MLDLTDKNVIVVGNGPSILKYEVGAEIDKFDIIIRVNGFRIKGFEKYIGTRTDIWAAGLATNAERSHLENKIDEIWALMPYRTIFDEATLKQKRRIHRFFNKGGVVDYPLDKIFHLEVNQFAEMISNMPVGRPSTGLSAIYVALNIYKAKSVTLHGFDYFQGAISGTPVPHYYEHEHRWKNLHHGNREMLWIEKLLSEKKVQFLRDSNINYEIINSIKDSYDLNVLKKDDVVYLDNQLKINIGPGDRWKEKHKKFSWKTMDYYFDADYKIDLRSKETWDIEDESVNIFYCSHVIEHLDDDAVQHMLNQCYDKLVDKGVLRIACPDLEKAYAAFREDNISFFLIKDVRTYGDTIEHRLVNWFASYKIGGIKGRPGTFNVSKEEVTNNFRNLTKDEFVKWCVSLIPNEADYKAHINGFYYDKVSNMLLKAGFTNIRKATWWDSCILELRQKHKTFDNRGKVSLYVECVK